MQASNIRFAAVLVALSLIGPAAALAEPGANGIDNPQPHLDAARALAAQQAGWRHPALVNCYRYEGTASQAMDKDPLPSRAFDNLIYIGTGYNGLWALDTSDGIIMIDTGNSQNDMVQIHLRKLEAAGLDPKRIKIVILSHGHPDHWGGARYLQQRFGAKVYESQADADWQEILSKDPAEQKGFSPPPKPDVIVKDGDTITLGDESIKVFITPGHTPGSLGMLIPVKDHGQPKLLAYITSITSKGLSPALHAAFDQSSQRFQKIITDAKIDGYITPHPNYDDAIYKFEVMASNAGRPNPFLNGLADTVLFLKIADECNLNNAQLELMTNPPGGRGPQQPEYKPAP
ncbi:MAG TPA: MBL fold metallo-hydrolase [Caulobacteraceae bacterium]|nr:MBL fold metallo-hydrolase [Caulobacteraceae bacterium]